MAEYHETPIQGFLRDVPLGYSRSAYAVEANPWTPRGDIEAAIFFRGSIVSSLGYIETSLGELCLRCSKMEEYAGLRESFPFSLDRRISYLRSVFGKGILSKYRGTAELFFDRVENLRDLRNISAHARMQVLPNWGVTFHHFPTSDAKSVIAESKRITLAEFDRTAWRTARLSRLCQKLIDQLVKLEDIPTVEW